MPTNTSKFNLVKPLKSEKYNVDQFNTNADTIDSQIYSKTEVDTALNSKVDETTTVNSKALSSNITINASDVPNTPAGNISATNVQNAINELDTEKANRVQEAWITPTLLNGYTGTVRYRKNQFSEIEIEGLIFNGVSGQALFILPTGYRPTSSRRFSGFVTGSVVGNVLILNTGEVTPSSVGTSHINIRFYEVI